MLASALVHLYPRAWRDRYGREMKDILASQRLSFRTIADIVAGAIDARLSPQRVVQLSEGATQVIKRTACNPAGASKEDQWRSAAWMMGGTVVLTLLGVVLRWQIGANSFSESLIYAAFPASLMLSSECTYLKRYSSTARMTMSAGGALFVVLVMWGATALGERI